MRIKKRRLLVILATAIKTYTLFFYNEYLHITYNIDSTPPQNSGSLSTFAHPVKQNRQKQIHKPLLFISIYSSYNKFCQYNYHNTSIIPYIRKFAYLFLSYFYNIRHFLPLRYNLIKKTQAQTFRFCSAS